MVRLARFVPPDTAAAGGLILAMAALLGLVSWQLAGAFGMVLAGVAVLAILIGLPALPADRVMRWMRAAPMRPSDAPHIVSDTYWLARQAGLATAPRLYWLPHWLPNALAVGSGSHPTLGLSVGAARSLSRRELRGVLAHEIAHLAAGDTTWLRLTQILGQLTRVMALVGLILVGLHLLVSSFAALPLWLPMLLALAPTAALLLQLAFSRNREFAADRYAATLTRDPMGLASALTRIERQVRRRRPFALAVGEGGPAFLRTHPPTEDRIRHLLSLVPARRRAANAGPIPAFLGAPRLVHAVVHASA